MDTLEFLNISLMIYIFVIPIPIVYGIFDKAYLFSAFLSVMFMLAIHLFGGSLKLMN